MICSEKYDNDELLSVLLLPKNSNDIIKINATNKETITTKATPPIAAKAPPIAVKMGHLDFGLIFASIFCFSCKISPRMGEKTLQQHIDYKFHCIYVLYK